MRLEGIAKHFNTGFGCVRLDDGGALFEVEFATGERIILRMSSATVASIEADEDESDAEAFTSWIALLELEAENAYRCLRSDDRGGFIFDVD
jgi:hypothetical protein